MPAQATTVVNISRGAAFDIYVGRPGQGLSGPWGNPFILGRDGTRDEVTAKYAAWIQTQPQLLARLPELQGQRLGCFCAPAGGVAGHDPLICHGQILARLADALPDSPPLRTTLRLTFTATSGRPAGGSVGTCALESANRPQPYVVRREYPAAWTPAQVAYQTLIAALDYILAVLTRTQRQPADFALEIAGDPPLVITQLSARATGPHPDLQPLHTRCHALLGRFGSYQLCQSARAERGTRNEE